MKKQTIKIGLINKIRAIFSNKKNDENVVNKFKAKEKTPKEMSMEIARKVHDKFKNWVTADQVYEKFKREFNNVNYTTSLLQTLVFYKLAVVKQLPDSRPQFKVTITSEVRKYEIEKTIEAYKAIIENLETELKTIKLKNECRRI